LEIQQKLFGSLIPLFAQSGGSMGRTWRDPCWNELFAKSEYRLGNKRFMYWRVRRQLILLGYRSESSFSSISGWIWYSRSTNTCRLPS